MRNVLLKINNKENNSYVRRARTSCTRPLVAIKGTPLHITAGKRHCHLTVFEEIY